MLKMMNFSSLILLLIIKNISVKHSQAQGRSRKKILHWNPYFDPFRKKLLL